MENEARRTGKGRRIADRGHHVHPNYKGQERRIIPNRRTQKKPGNKQLKNHHYIYIQQS